MELDTLIDGYRLYCQADGKSPHTIRRYMGKLSVFQAYLAHHDHTAGEPDLDVQTIRAFIVHMQTSVKADELNPHKPTRSEPLSPYTIQGYVRVLKAFFTWAHRESLMNENPTRLVKVPRAPKSIVPTFTTAQVETLLGAIDRTKPTGYRDFCMALTLLDTGMRLSELVGLELDAITLDEGYCRVIGKGSKERIVPLGASLQKVLWKYVNRHRPKPALPGTGELFLTRDGRRLSPKTVYQMIKECGEGAGITGVRCSPHTFRHTFAKTFLLSGGDLFSLQKILGHSSLEVVRMYVNLASDDVQVQHRRYSPVDTMRLTI